MLNDDQTIELRRGRWYEEEGGVFFTPVTNKRTPKRERIRVPAEMWEWYQLAVKRLGEAQEELDRAIEAIQTHAAS